MRVTLPESARDRNRSFGGTAVSTLVHAILIGGTVTATGITAERISEPERSNPLVYVVPERRAPDVPRPEAPRPASPTPLDEVTPPVVEPLIDFATVPSELPPPSTIIGTTRLDEFGGAPLDSTPRGAVGPPTSEPFNEFMVEKAVRARDSNPTPRYPSLLANAGVEGVVYAQFVVDTTGRVEAESIRFPKSDHALFERAVRDVLVRSRFSPAEAGNQRVRQLVEQAFSFTLKR